MLLFIILFLSLQSFSQTRFIHVYVALCHNDNQGIVPVPTQLGNGQDPDKNLYWGAMFGLRSYFKNISHDWQKIKDIEPKDPEILDAILYKHSSQDFYLLAEAYDGSKIKSCTEQFLRSSNGQGEKMIEYRSNKFMFGGNSDLVAYIGHDGLMDFSVNVKYNAPVKDIDAIVLACFSKDYFAIEFKRSGAIPVLWTTHLMAPEAYTLEAALRAWLNNKSLKESAAQAYNKFQKCGLKGARNLFSTGF
ncbi:MAG: hypothetical protein HKN39_07415 [Flavobacteriales bacterium]|nr:hypothetical protein [Flavobacteriales bacterium]